MSARPLFLMPANGDVSEPARLEIKAVFEDGTFEGYASLFDAEDMGRDVVMRGAFAESLRAKAPPASKCCSSMIRQSPSAYGKRSVKMPRASTCADV